MSADQLQKLFEINGRAFQLNVGGLTHEDSLIQPPRGGNCLNWVAGHIVANRNFVLTLLGEKPIWADEDAAPYRRGSAPIRDGARARPFGKIVEEFSRSQERIHAALGRVTERELSQRKEKETVAESLHFLQFHEAYHIGQAGILRRMAGKEGAIP